MIVVKIAIFGFIVLLFSIGMIMPSFAHTTVEVGEYKIEVGWGIEPPVVGIRNDIVFKITEPGENEGTYKGITSAFKNLEATAMYGGATKKIDINSDPRPGYYFSPIIPTKTGSYTMDLKGEISGTLVDVQIPIEDVIKEAQDKGIDGEVVELDQAPKLDLRKKHTIEVIIDRIKIRQGLQQRLAESIEIERLSPIAKPLVFTIWIAVSVLPELAPADAPEPFKSSLCHSESIIGEP